VSCEQGNGGCDKKGDHDHDHDHEDMMDLGVELETASQVLLEMRAQNLELLKVAAQIAGYAGPHSPLKPNDLRQAMSSIWDAYSQLYQWVDPEEESDDDDEDGDDDE
jgi:hypothetical protein